jgi:4-amino-4-deoxy-L-arabinose transferase-like glycosyltransferase
MRYTLSPVDPSADRASLRLAAAFAAATLALLLLTNAGYGYFRDELYFLACGERLAWGYVDFAPMVAVVAKLSRAVFGDSLHAIRFFPAVAAAVTVFLTGLMARELGGRCFAVALASIGVLAAPILLAMGGMLTMNAFEPVFWTACVYVLLVTLRRGDPRLLPLFGVLAGLGIENKHSTLFFLTALGFALLVTPERRLLASKWMWIAAAAALAIFLPNLVWQQQHGWPTLEDLSNVSRSNKNVKLGPLAFLGQQILLLNPLGALVWAGGLAFLLFHPAAKGRGASSHGPTWRCWR